jgi:hypothetical protein
VPLSETLVSVDVEGEVELDVGFGDELTWSAKLCISFAS